jgi:hypothetical protein
VGLLSAIVPICYTCWKGKQSILGTDHLTCRAGGGDRGVFMGVFSFRKNFSDNTRDRIFVFLNLTLGYMTKSLNQIIFFSPPKSEYFFQQHWQSEYLFRKKNTPPGG